VELRGLEPLASCMPCKSGNSPAQGIGGIDLRNLCARVPVSAC